MHRYEDKNIQTKALSLIPVLLLEQRAQERMRMLQKDVKKGVTDDLNISIQELLLIELLAWFKESFFEWVNSPECDYCFSDTKFSHMSTDPILLAGANRVEMHRCEQCSQYTPFRRYTDLSILLETREGRCGEWADTFTLMCRAMGWDARWVCSETDHVWTEVYSIAQKRWLHCDPCENTCDNPLIYECGWGTNLSYVLAYSHEEVQDVTWRYSADHAKMLANRNKCSEHELIQTLITLRANRQRQLSEARRNYLTRRCLLELAELMFEKKPSDADKQGRTSGSLAWRLQRGETNTPIAENKIWSATEHELCTGKMSIRYSAALNRYERLSSPQDNVVVETVERWDNGVYSARDIFRKEEKDWKIVYLCRQETASDGEVQWKFESGKSGNVINNVSVVFNHAVFENGHIDIQLCGENKCIKLTSGTQHLDSNDFSGSKYLLIKATLKGGKGDCAWQHAQLFRQPMSSQDYPFSVTVTFKSTVQFHERT